MGWTSQADEMTVSKRTRTGTVRAEWTGTFVDIFLREKHVDAFRPKMDIIAPEQLRRLMMTWIKSNDLPALLAQH